MDELYPLFFENLSDSIPSVRQGAAVSLGNVVKAYGELKKAQVSKVIVISKETRLPCW